MRATYSKHTAILCLFFTMPLSACSTSSTSHEKAGEPSLVSSYARPEWGFSVQYPHGWQHEPFGDTGPEHAAPSDVGVMLTGEDERMMVLIKLRRLGAYAREVATWSDYVEETRSLSIPQEAVVEMDSDTSTEPSIHRHHIAYRSAVRGFTRPMHQEIFLVGKGDRLASLYVLHESNNDAELQRAKSVSAAIASSVKLP